MILRILKKIIPKPVFEFFQPAYHYLLALGGALLYRFPSKKLHVIGITGTKGKTTMAELVNSILEEAGYRTALASTLRFKTGSINKRNLFKMTMPGRFFMQKFLRDAVEQGATHAIIEMTSEGAKQFRHKFIYPEALIFTNLAPEHIESHGSYQKYLDAKLSIGRELEGKEKTAIIANADDKEGAKFLALNIRNKIPYSRREAMSVKADERGSSFQIGKLVVHSGLPGLFNVSNMLGAIAYARFAGIPDAVIKRGLEKIDSVRGRMEKVNAGQNFDVVIDYAHTPDSLKAAYEAYVPRLTHKAIGAIASRPSYETSSGKAGLKKNDAKHHLICVLGSTGGGRDKWKRQEMGKIAEKFCEKIFLTNEDPYDEDPAQIISDIKKGIKRKPCEIVMDRREAIRKAVEHAKDLDGGLAAKNLNQNKNEKVAVLITGKGTDPYIMGPNGSKQEWDDSAVAREEIKKIYA